MLLPCSQIHTCARSAFLLLRAGGGKKKLVCKPGRNSQLLAVSLRRAFLICLSGTIATASHNLQTATQKAAVQALLEELCLCPVAMGPLPRVIRGEHATACIPKGVQALVTFTPVETHRWHTQPGALSTQGTESVLENSPLPS